MLPIVNKSDDNRDADALTQAGIPNYELVEIFESSKQSGLNFMKFRFIISDGEKFFVMRPQFIKRRSVRLWCYKSNSQGYYGQKNDKSYCRASLTHQFNDDIQTEVINHSAKSKRVYIAPSTKREILLLKSNYTVVPHLVSNNSF